MQKNKRIGVFDSGIGGLSLLKAGYWQLPNEAWLYVADEAYLPYGDKTTEKVRERAKMITEFFIKCDVKAIVIACNTATATAIDFLRETYRETIFIGVEPAVKPAAKLTKTKVIGILATDATTESLRLNKLVQTFGEGIKVLVQPCPGLVESIENGNHHEAKTHKLIKMYVEPMLSQGVDVLALGCTHYSFVKKAIRDIVGDSVTLIDTSKPVIDELKYRLSRQKLLSNEKNSKIEFWTTNSIKNDSSKFETFWGNPIKVGYLNI